MTQRISSNRSVVRWNEPHGVETDCSVSGLLGLHTPHDLERYLAQLICGNKNITDLIRQVPAALLSRLIDRAIDLGVFGIVDERVFAARIDLPSLLQNRLQRERERTAIQNRHRFKQSLRLIECLADDEIPYVLLKGAALIACGAADIDARPMTDVDILIRAQDAARVEQIITNLGGRAGADLVQDDFYPRFHYEREYLLGNPPIKIDLHVRAFRPTLFAMRTPVDAFLQECDDAELLGQSVRIPNATMMLLHLAVHAACHGGKHLRWLYDVYRWLTINHEQIDPQQVARRAESWRLTAPLRLALLNVGSVFNAAELVQPYLNALSQPNDALAYLTLSQAPRALDRPAYDVLINALGVPGWQRKWQYLGAVGLPHESHLREHYRGNHIGWRWVAHGVRIGKRVLPRRATDAA